jgi:hypothetical protein
MKTKSKLLESFKETFLNNTSQEESVIKSMKMTLHSPSRPQFVTMKEGNIYF